MLARTAVLASLAAFLLTGCRAGEAGPWKAGQMRLALTDLTGTSSTGAAPGSVMDSIELDASSAAGTRQAGRRIRRGDVDVTLPITVPVGRNDFNVRVTSALGTLLLDGTAPLEVHDDGFSVVVPLTPRAPILVVAPDSLDLTNTGNGVTTNLVMFNRGTDTLFWTFSPDSVTPPCLRCFNAFTAAPSGALVSGGILLRNASADVVVSVRPLVKGFYTLPFATRQGNAVVLVNVK